MKDQDIGDEDSNDAEKNQKQFEHQITQPIKQKVVENANEQM